MRSAALVAGTCAAVLTVVLAGCGSGGYVSQGAQSAGKQYFVSACGGCHVLADAGTAGTIGPNLDDAFAQSRADGMTTATFTQVVAGQIRHPITNPSVPDNVGMPGVDTTLPSCDDVESGAFCVDDQDQAVNDVATYVGTVAGTGVTAKQSTDGKSIFAASCGSCHTLAVAGTSGNVGPDLDGSTPSKELVVDRVTNGRGGMPSFRNSLSPEQIEAVADYVSTNAGK